MDNNEMNYLKHVLLRELKKLEKRPIVNMSLVEEDELDGFDNHPADAATDLEMMTTEFALDEHSKNEMKKIEEALMAMEEGSYGLCKVCNEPISFMRLEAIPTALTCVEHAEVE